MMKQDFTWLSKVVETPKEAKVEAKAYTEPRGRIFHLFKSISKSKEGVTPWSLRDVIITLQLLEKQKSTNIHHPRCLKVEEMIYNLELAIWAYEDNSKFEAQDGIHSEIQIVKFVPHSGPLRPASFIGLDTYNKLVIVGFRGTSTFADINSDMAATSEAPTHFGITEAARWFLAHEIGSIRHYLEEHEGFRLRLTGHSLGGGIVSVLAILIHHKTREELGFDPETVTAVGYGTPPCVSATLVEKCTRYVPTVCMLDDIVPRLSIDNIKRLRNELMSADLETQLKEEEFSNLINILKKADFIVSSMKKEAREIFDLLRAESEAELIVSTTRCHNLTLQRRRVRPKWNCLFRGVCISL